MRKLVLFNIIKKSVSSANSRDKLQFVNNSMKCLAFDLTKNTISQMFNQYMSIYSWSSSAIRIFLQNRILVLGWVVVGFWFMSSFFIHLVISQNELQLLGRVEKWSPLPDYQLPQCLRDAIHTHVATQNANLTFCFQPHPPTMSTVAIKNSKQEKCRVWFATINMWNFIR